MAASSASRGWLNGVPSKRFICKMTDSLRDVRLVVDDKDAGTTHKDFPLCLKMRCNLARSSPSTHINVWPGDSRCLCDPDTRKGRRALSGLPDRHLPNEGS